MLSVISVLPFDSRWQEPSALDSNGAAEIFSALTNNHGWRVLSVLADLRQVEAWVFGRTVPYEFSPWWSVFALGGMILGSAALLRTRVRAVDVVGGS